MAMRRKWPRPGSNKKKAQLGTKIGVLNESLMLNVRVAGKSLGQRHIAKILNQGALSEAMHSTVLM
jgi:hypothetical protein